MDSVPILTFHAVDNGRSVISFSPQAFQSGMARLHENGYRTLNLLDLVDLLRSRTHLPPRSFAITFDDGYRSVYEQAFPILQRYGFSAMLFLTTGDTSHTGAGRLPPMCGRPMLNWNEIREMHRWGMTFGAHTLTHPDLRRLSYDRIKAEIAGSQQIIEDVLGVPVRCFAYPYGLYDTRSYDIVRQSFTCACSDRLGLAHTGTDFFAIERVDAYYVQSGHGLEMISGRWFPWYVRARNLPRQIRRSIRALNPTFNLSA